MLEVAQQTTTATNKKIYIGNLSPDVTKEEITKHFALDATPYLKSAVKIELPSRKGYAFLFVPEAFGDHVIGFDGTELNNKKIKVEVAKAKSPSQTQRTNGRLYNRGPNNQRRVYNYGFNRQNYDQHSQFLKPLVVPPKELLHAIDVVNLTNQMFANDTDYVIARALSAGIFKMVVTGNTLKKSRVAVSLSKTRPGFLYAAVGVHPHWSQKEWSDNSLKELEELVQLPEVVAVGEVGLDLNRNYSPPEVQETVFEKQLLVACKYKKTLLAHEREAHTKFMEVIGRHRNHLPQVIIHCFTGSKEEIKAYVDMGFYIGITGFICKEPRSRQIREAIKDGTLPLEKIIIETDAPYMVPSLPLSQMDDTSRMLLMRCREGRNEPCTLPVIVKTIAKCMGREAKEVACVTTANAARVFGLTAPQV